jgi:glyoxylase-like metal-dependent hydrolase (beta-lactamase superfamily II)
MESIANNVYIETQYIGVTLGLISLPRGQVLVDAPPAPEDSRAWRAALLSRGGGPERVLINLDAHPDRTIGARSMDCIIIAHEKTAQAYRNRPTAFKPLGEETGAEWENIPALGSVRWVPPEISFSQQMTLHWGDFPVLLEHHPGPGLGAIWVILPDEKVVFVGDAVLKNQPPYLANANLKIWIGTLELLLGPAYRGFTVVSGRDGTVASTTVRKQLDYLKRLQSKLEKLASKSSKPEAMESLIQPLLTPLKFASSRQKQYAQRLSYGLSQYYSRHYHLSGSDDKE